MTEERDITDPDPDQQDPESGPASEDDGAQEDESVGDPGLDRQVEGLKHQGDKLADEIEDVSRDWEAKQEDPSVPGAQPAADDAEDEDKPTEAQSGRGEGAEDAGQ